MVVIGADRRVSIILFSLLGLPSIQALATPTGDACRKEICQSAVEGCMRTDLSSVRIASTDARKKEYCDAFFHGCMTRNLAANMPWYSRETINRFLKCTP